MKRWLNSIKHLLRRLFTERPLHEIELENIRLRERVEWLRAALSGIHRMAEMGASMSRIEAETDWMLNIDAEDSTKLESSLQ